MEPQPITATPVQADPQVGGQQGGVSMPPRPFDLAASGDPPPGSKQPRPQTPPPPPNAQTPAQQQRGPAQGPPTPARAPLTPQQRELTGQFDPTAHTDFVVAEIREDFNNRQNLLRREAAVAFHRMVQAAANVPPVRGRRLNITSISGTRNYDAQANTIWDLKWTGRRLGDGNRNFSLIPDPVDRANAIMEESSMPGTSRHHWGTDFDINSTTANDWETNPELIRLYIWLRANARSFGFGQTYDAQTTDSPPGTRSGGYDQEKWHWSYIPLAAGYQADYVAQVSDQDIAGLGFQGAATALTIHPVANYVNNVAQDCMSANGYGRPSILGQVDVTVVPLPAYERTDRSSSVVFTVRQARSFNYYDTHTDTSGRTWVLIEEGWLIQQDGTPQRRGAVRPAPNATLRPTPAPTPPSSSGPPPSTNPTDRPTPPNS
jgi:zinc D-Ala-D-Ala carboxypeptidase